MAGRFALFGALVLLNALPACSPHERAGSDRAASRIQVVKAVETPSAGSHASARAPTRTAPRLRRAPAHSVRGTLSLGGRVEAPGSAAHSGQGCSLSPLLSCSPAFPPTVSPVVLLVAASLSPAASKNASCPLRACKVRGHALGRDWASCFVRCSCTQ